ncbi:ABC transporter permease subunit [Ochrobactrum sp. RH2CCR150]|uniref:ABC transporter permease n=1 Tax=Ochrobactrum sp. RH2CCR150 TaxID=2587044 RepID=UPI0015FC745E|nr:putative spermidine/putrescine transport system permease protein [Ochrobactrum sp. RH2CCR150]
MNNHAFGKPSSSTAFARITVIIVFLLFMIVPIVATGLFSISTRWDRSLWPEGFTMQWWSKVVEKRAFRTTLTNSLTVSIATVLLSLALVAPTAYWAHTKLPRAKPLLEILAIIPFGFPAVVLALGLIRFYGGMSGSFVSSPVLLVCAYVAITLPFMYRPIMNALETLDTGLMTEAAGSLGAAEYQTFLFVILPNIRSGIVNGSLLVFSAAFVEFALANLLVGTRFKTFPMYLVEFTRFDGRQASALALISFACAWMISLAVLSSSTGKRRVSSPKKQRRFAAR